MRTPISSQPSRQDPDMTEELATTLAALLVQEYRRQHGPHHQQDLDGTVRSPQRLNHADQPAGTAPKDAA